ncbi:MAG: CBS domain-containing protein [Gammaproteobacteria bacterium]|nr:CBS domain-containing protein [Gammaproteobacteria bacterium]
MDKQDADHLEANDFLMALQEMGTYVDVSVDDLMAIHLKAEKYARIRKKEGRQVESLMTQPVITVHTDTTLSDAAHLMVSSKISGLPVVDDNDKLVGIITEADFLRALGVPSHHTSHSVWQTLENMFHKSVKIREPVGVVADLMVANVVTITPQHTLQQVLGVMKQNQIKRVIVCDEEKHVVGMITRSDLVKMFFDHFKKPEAE